jgi:hypothetical protein
MWLLSLARYHDSSIFGLRSFLFLVIYLCSPQAIGAFKSTTSNRSPSCSQPLWLPIVSLRRPGVFGFPRFLGTVEFRSA